MLASFSANPRTGGKGPKITISLGNWSCLPNIWEGYQQVIFQHGLFCFIFLSLVLLSIKSAVLSYQLFLPCDGASFCFQTLRAGRSLQQHSILEAKTIFYSPVHTSLVGSEAACLPASLAFLLHETILRVCLFASKKSVGWEYSFSSYF